MRFFKTGLAIVCGLVLTATGLWAAGGSDSDDSASAADKEMVLDPTTGEMVTAPQYGGTITFAVKREPPSTDVHFGGGASRGVDGVAEKLGMVNWGIDRDVYDIRGAFFYYPSVSILTGRLAESWETPDPTTFVFHIRPGVHWHDKAPMNGRELTAQDIEYNFHRALGLGSGFTEKNEGFNAGIVSLPIESVMATEDRTVVIKLTQPQPNALETVLTSWGTHMMPPEVIKQHGDVKDWRNLVGTGPFMLTDWVDGSSMTWTKNPDYWGFDEKYPQNRLPYFDGITGLVMTDDATILSALRSGQLDYVGGTGVASVIYIPQAESLQRTNPEIELYGWSTRSENSFAYNMTQDGPFSRDVRVRRAMQMALDLETMNSTYFKGFAKWEPQGMIGNAIVGYNTPFAEWPAEVQKGYMYDPEGAEKLLDEAGYPRGADGTRFKAELTGFGFWDVDYQQLAASYWDAIGIDVSINVVDSSESGALIREHTYGDMVSSILAFDYIGPSQNKR